MKLYNSFMDNLIVSLHDLLRVSQDVGGLKFQLHNYFSLMDIINGFVGY